MPHKDKEKYNEYMRVKILERYHKRRIKAIAVLGGKCVICGTSENLEIDHIRAHEKAFGISKLWSVSEERYLEELAKCQLLCNNHHKLKTKLNKEHLGGRNKILGYSHGTGYMYYKDKCKCQICKDWRKKYRSKEVTYAGEKTELHQ